MENLGLKLKTKKLYEEILWILQAYCDLEIGREVFLHDKKLTVSEALNELFEMIVKLQYKDIKEINIDIDLLDKWNETNFLKRLERLSERSEDRLEKQFEDSPYIVIPKLPDEEIQKFNFKIQDECYQNDEIIDNCRQAINILQTYSEQQVTQNNDIEQQTEISEQDLEKIKIYLKPKFNGIGQGNENLLDVFINDLKNIKLKIEFVAAIYVLYNSEARKKNNRKISFEQFKNLFTEIFPDKKNTLKPCNVKGEPEEKMRKTLLYITEFKG